MYGTESMDVSTQFGDYVIGYTVSDDIDGDRYVVFVDRADGTPVYCEDADSRTAAREAVENLRIEVLAAGESHILPITENYYSKFKCRYSMADTSLTQKLGETQ